MGWRGRSSRCRREPVAADVEYCGIVDGVDLVQCGSEVEALRSLATGIIAEDVVFVIGAVIAMELSEDMAAFAHVPVAAVELAVEGVDRGRVADVIIFAVGVGV